MKVPWLLVYSFAFACSFFSARRLIADNPLPTTVQTNEKIVGEGLIELPLLRGQEPYFKLRTDKGSYFECYRNGPASLCYVENVCLEYNGDSTTLNYFASEVVNEVQIQASLIWDCSVPAIHRVHVSRATRLPSKWEKEFYYQFRVFHRKNTYHQLHDDSFPIYHTMSFFRKEQERYLLHTKQKLEPASCGGIDKNAVLLIQNFSENHLDFYSQFTVNPIQPTAAVGSVCIRAGVIGLATLPRLLHLGHKKPVSLVPEANGLWARAAADYMLMNENLPPTTFEKLHPTPLLHDSGHLTNGILTSEMQIKLKQSHVAKKPCNVVIVGRQIVRRMFNMGDLYGAIRLLPNVNKVDVYFNEFEQHHNTLRMFRNASVVVGIHGASLANLFFMPRGATLIELFPFGLDQDHVAYYKEMSQAPNMGLNYKSWQNWNGQHTQHNEAFFRVPRCSLLECTQTAVDTLESIILFNKKHEYRFEDPADKFYKFQDSIVDVDAIAELVSDACDGH